MSDPIPLKCPHCGLVVRPGARFCGWCRYPLSAPSVCQKCGAQLTAGARFCPECGASLASEKTVEGGCFKTGIAVLIALVALVGAFVAWRAALAADAAGNASSAGLAAALNNEEAHTFNTVRLYQHYQAYFSYVRNKTLAEVLDRSTWDLVLTVTEAQLEELQLRRNEAYDMAAMSQYFLVTNYLDAHDNYLLAREAGQLQAEAAQQNDLDAPAHFQEADRLQNKSSALVGVLVCLTVSLWFFTATEGIKYRLKYLTALAGALFLVSSLVVILVIEVLV